MVAGCGSNVDIFPESTTTTTDGDGNQLGGDQSGGRLKHKYLQAEDGLTHRLGIYDTQTKETCTFMQTADGKTRCVPSESGLIAGYGYYSDDACTTPLAVRAAACKYTPTFMLFDSSGMSGDGCSGKIGVYTAGIQWKASTVHVGSAASCLESKVVPGFEFFKLGGEIALDKFVAAVEKTE